jgi:hypothetical protein
MTSYSLSILLADPTHRSMKYTTAEKADARIIESSPAPLPFLGKGRGMAVCPACASAVTARASVVRARRWG